MNSLSQYEFGGRPVTAINLLLMISEMEVHTNISSIWDLRRTWTPSMR